MENKDIIDQMKRIQLGMSANLNESNKNEFNRDIEFSGGEGINIDSSKNKVSISTSFNSQNIILPSGSGVLGISNGSLFVYGTTECE
jgi:hypothetical protein